MDLSWNRRLTLRLLRDEATALLEVTLPAVEPVADVVLGLANAPHLFVRVLGAVGGIITKADLQKFDPHWTWRSSTVERSTT